jgi:hypothetical protein
LIAPWGLARTIASDTVESRESAVEIGVNDVGEIAARPYFSLLASFSGAFLPTRTELAIRCV